MPTPQSSNTNQFRCKACGRYFNEEQELQDHQRECVAAKGAGSGSSQMGAGEREEGDDREWVSTS